MRTVRDAPGRPDRGLFGVVPPGRPTDVAVAVLVGVAQLGLTTLAARHRTDRLSLDLLSYLLLAVGPVALLWRRRSPVGVLAVVMGACVLYFALGYPYGPAWLALIVALWTAVTGGARRAAWVTTFVGLAVYFTLAAVVGRVEPINPATVAAHTSSLLLVLAVAELAMAGRQRRLAADRTRAEEDRRRAGEERMRIARELHDVVAHHITLVNAQAGVAHHLMRTDPEHAYQALERIRDTSRAALDELRATVGLLRQSGEQAAPREPAPGLAGLDDLLDAFRHSGLSVVLERTGEPVALAPITDLTAYRIIQEALTNTHKHAGAATAHVRLGFAAGVLRLTVEDDGSGTGGSGTGTGHGMIGMHERARAVGGTLSAGPRPGRGFRIDAELPLPTGAGRKGCRP
ncbi:MAG: sensor histidine kinase [Actinomycetes bacterium]